MYSFNDFYNADQLPFNEILRSKFGGNKGPNLLLTNSPYLPDFSLRINISGSCAPPVAAAILVIGEMTTLDSVLRRIVAVFESGVKKASCNIIVERIQ